MDKHEEREDPPTPKGKVGPPATVTSGLETTKGPEISSSSPLPASLSAAKRPMDIFKAAETELGGFAAAKVNPRGGQRGRVPRTRPRRGGIGRGSPRTDMSAFGLGSTQGLAHEIHKEWHRLHIINFNGGSLNEEEEKRKASANEAALALQHAKDRNEASRRREKQFNEAAEFHRFNRNAMSAEEMDNLRKVVEQVEGHVRDFLPPSVSAESGQNEIELGDKNPNLSDDPVLDEGDE